MFTHTYGSLEELKDILASWAETLSNLPEPISEVLKHRVLDILEDVGDKEEAASLVSYEDISAVRLTTYHEQLVEDYYRMLYPNRSYQYNRFVALRTLDLLQQAIGATPMDPGRTIVTEEGHAIWPPGLNNYSDLPC